eukprot:364221-Chlamydomonas_euryale.AAC.2
MCVLRCVLSQARTARQTRLFVQRLISFRMALEIPPTDVVWGFQACGGQRAKQSCPTRRTIAHRSAARLARCRGRHCRSGGEPPSALSSVARRMTARGRARPAPPMTASAAKAEERNHAQVPGELEAEAGARAAGGGNGGEADGAAMTDFERKRRELIARCVRGWAARGRALGRGPRECDGSGYADLATLSDATVEGNSTWL